MAEHTDISMDPRKSAIVESATSIEVPWWQDMG